MLQNQTLNKNVRFDPLIDVKVCLLVVPPNPTTITLKCAVASITIAVKNGSPRFLLRLVGALIICEISVRKHSNWGRWPSWSKALDSSSSVVTRVGSNPTLLNSFLLFFSFCASSFPPAPCLGHIVSNNVLLVRKMVLVRFVFPWFSLDFWEQAHNAKDV